MQSLKEDLIAIMKDFHFAVVFGLSIFLIFQIANILSIISLPTEVLHQIFVVLLIIIPMLYAIFFREMNFYRAKPDYIERELRRDQQDIYRSISQIRGVMLSLKKIISEIKSKDSNAKIPELGIDFDKEILKADERLECTRIAEAGIPDFSAELRNIISKWHTFALLSVILTMSLAVSGYFVGLSSNEYLAYCLFGSVISSSLVTMPILYVYGRVVKEISSKCQECMKRADNIRFTSIYFSEIERKLK